MATVVPHPRVELERLYSEHGEKVRAICGSILRNRHEAEDASQQVFVAALRALRRGTVPRDAAAWLATIARHESWARARRSPTGALPEELEDRAQEDPATTVVRRAEIAETWETIANLPASQREALLLREVRGLGYDELADDLRLTQASVRSLLNRARTNLRMQLDRGAAVFTGAQWVSVLARIFDSASSPALPSAGRAAAVGLGALAIAGGAVVGSEPTHHAHVWPVVHRAATFSTTRQAAVVSGEDLRAESSHRGPGSPGRLEDRRRSSEHGGSGSQTSGRDSSGSGSGGDGSSSGDSGSSGSTSGSDGGQVTSASGGSVDTVTTSDSSSGTTLSTSGRDGGSSGSSESSSTSGSSDGSGGTSGTSDGGSTDGGS